MKKGITSHPSSQKKFLLYAGTGGVLALLVLFGWFVVQAFSGRIPIPAGILLGPFTVRYYSLCLLFGVLAGYLLIRQRMEQYQVSENLLTDFITAGMIFGLVGARLGYVLQNFSYFLSHPLEILGITPQGFQGIAGLSIHGALLSLLAFLFFFQKWRGVSRLKMGDFAVPSLALGQAIGRWGNFFNQELYGYPTNLPWKMYVDEAHRLQFYTHEAFFHPVFLYESLWSLFTLGILLRVERKGSGKPGNLMFLYGILYGIGRFWVEIFRIEPREIFGLSRAQVVSLLFVLVFGGLIFFWRHR